ncbi:MAG: HepT-like ribonuclease domain-containing protein [Pseudomonadota bacterium]
MSTRLRQMAKFRNRLVHLYGEIDDRKVHAIIQTDLGDIERFRTLIMKRFH